MIDPSTVSAKPFPKVVNRDLRLHVISRKDLISDRQELFKERDGLEVQIEEAEAKGTDCTDAEREHSRVVRRIRKLGKEIKWRDQEIARLIQKNWDKEEDKKLWDSLDLAPIPAPPPDVLAAKAPKEKKGKDAGVKDDRPVGEPDAPGQLKIAGAGDDEDPDQSRPGKAFTDRMEAEEAADEGIPPAVLEFPGTFELRPLGKGKPAKLVAGDFENLAGQVADFFGVSFEEVSDRGVVRASGTHIAQVTRIADAPEAVQPGESVDRSTGEITPKPRKKRRPKAAK